MSRSASPAVATAHGRADVQGLRAIAVLLVIGGHLLKLPPSGFVGVDVFFVISGFVITGSLLRSAQAGNGISLADFYRRRVKRIAPAAVLVIASTVAVAAILPTGRFARTVEDALWALVAAGNWRVIDSRQFHDVPVDQMSPLSHFWSLGVEEQFYLVWPLLLFVSLWITAKRGWRLRAVWLVAAVGTGGSFLVAVLDSLTVWGVPYFSTLDRAWELGIGVLLALGARRLTALPDPSRPMLAFGGLFVVLASAVLVRPDFLYPAPASLLPTLGTAALITAGMRGAPTLTAQLLGSRAMQYVGALSYSLYLWHLPVILTAFLLLPPSPALLNVVVILFTTGGLAVLSFHLVEDPLRRSPWRSTAQRLLLTALRPVRLPPRLSLESSGTSPGSPAERL